MLKFLMQGVEESWTFEKMMGELTALFSEEEKQG
jgi:hypothetical protein